MCVTPLQMVIAENIIRLNPKQQFDAIVTVYENNDKHKFYFERLKSVCNNALYLRKDEGVYGFVEYLKIVKESNLESKYENLYLASIDSKNFQYFISRDKKAKVYTFDDGTANIISNSLYYSNIKPSFFRRKLLSILGVKYYMQDIKKKSLMHYTIYKDVPNIVSNTKSISLYKKEAVKKGAEKTKQVNIYLGQPLQEIDSHLDNEYILKLIEKLNIDVYYPHPREKNIPTGNFSIVDSDLIFEDYIVDFLQKDNDTHINIYSFTSSALLNLSSIKDLNLIYIHNEYLYDRFEYFYTFAKNNFNIHSLKID